MLRPYLLLLILVLVSTLSCSDPSSTSEVGQEQPLYELLEAGSTGIDFANTLTYDRDFNVYTYRNYYNGGGVAIGDVNGDSLADIYFTANLLPNRLYINNGDWTYTDVTEEAGVAGSRAWSTGVSMVDINADGHLDIYVCNSGDVEGDNKENELFINDGTGKFTELAAQYGLNDKGFSTHASFFDYDKDGDLDAYLLNNSFQAIGSFNLKLDQRPRRDALGGDKLMRNDNGVFVDVSEEAGIYGSVIGFGLGVTVADLNNDNWEDIFISNDFFERDYLYINKQDGTFDEVLTEQIQSISGASMGADIADINNDGYADIFVTEMLPSDYQRLKSVTTFENWDKYQYNVMNGYHHQFTRNVLHLNNKNGTYSEISRLLGIEASDWSWGALLFDMDNDGYRDLYIANGIYRDLTDQDYLQYVANESVLASLVKDEGVNYKELIDIIPSRSVPNHAFRNQGDLSFKRFGASGLETTGFSNGSAYGDLDNDGDLDLVVNNVNGPPFVYRNRGSDNNYLKLVLSGSQSNPLAYGAKALIKGESGNLVYELQPSRGFQSSVEPNLLIGLGQQTSAMVEIVWPDGRQQALGKVAANQTLYIKKSDSPPSTQEAKPGRQLLPSDRLNYTHKENKFVDFNRERLIYTMQSTQGPAVAEGDLNGDGVSDLVIGGSKGVATQIMMGSADGSYRSMPEQVSLTALAPSEHVDIELFDADGDGDLDMYLAAGGSEHTKFSPFYYDRLLLNDGSGRFITSNQNLPLEGLLVSTGAVAAGDLDGDGDLDLVVGERLKVGQYGAPTAAYVLRNDGSGRFTDASADLAPDLASTGMVTDIKIADLDGDDRPEIVIAGEYMDVQVYKSKGQKYELQDGTDGAKGWWNTLHLADLNGDGLTDIVAGNHGLNSRFRATPQATLRLYFSDYDKNGYGEGILASQHSDGEYYPFALRHKLLKQLAYLTKKYPDYASFKDQSMADIFLPEQLDSAFVREANEMRSMVFFNTGNLAFQAQALPTSAQVSPIYAVSSQDVDKDGDLDLIMGGNLYGVKPEIGRFDASYGHILINDGSGSFEDKAVDYGLSVSGEMRSITTTQAGFCLFFNNAPVRCYDFE